ncbi:hypothetical protein LWI29_013525 [Acer saccharum]|uniref:Uncharacterized protein n=1 Tax=Acer saccharum TaxID=4024 RepID=A0AA39SL86_ACESA|nr:hypothetical protein LWI29_013525 [Acer saccharum]
MLRDLYLLGILPYYVIDVHFLPPNLRKLTLSLSQLTCDPMPVLGKLPHLIRLRLFGDSYTGKQITCLSGGFLKLRLLNLWKLLLQDWTVEEGAMPCLNELEIRDCYNMKPPEGLKNVTTLRELVITNSSTKKIYLIKGRDFDGYVLSPLEHILNQISDGSGKYEEGWFIPNKLFSPQVLNPTTMAVSEMREALNQLASTHNVEYFIFGFNAHEMTMDDPEKYAFIRKQLKDLEDDGRLTTKWFTFVDESWSTIMANDFLNKFFPELNDPQWFFKMYKPVRDDPHYKDPRDQNFTRDLAKVRKRMLDSYSAYCFTWVGI